MATYGGRKMCEFLYSNNDVKWEVDCVGICELCVFCDNNEESIKEQNEEYIKEQDDQ